MRVMGILTTTALAVIGAGAVVVAVRSMPDIRRYLEMRRR